MERSSISPRSITVTELGRENVWVPLVVAQGLELPARFALRFEVDVEACEGEVMVQMLARTDDAADFFWTGFRAVTKPQSSLHDS